MADYVINEKYREKKTTVPEESKEILKLAANLIKAKMWEQEFKKEAYSSV